MNLLYNSDQETDKNQSLFKKIGDQKIENNIILITVCGASIKELENQKFYNLNSFAQIIYNGVTYKTEIDKIGELNPRWYTTFKIYLKNFDSDIYFNITRKSDQLIEIMGEVYLSIKEIINLQTGKLNKWFQLKNQAQNSTGTIRIETRLTNKTTIINLLKADILDTNYKIKNYKKRKSINQDAMSKQIWSKLKNNFLYQNQIDFFKLEGSEEAETEEINHIHCTSCSSIEGDELPLKKKKAQNKFCIICPSSSFKMGWDTLINILIIINCFSTPVDLAFPDYRSNNDVYLGILNTIDFIFLFDIIITFFTAYENETLDIIDDHKAIANNYIKGWFIFDVVSIFPTDLVAQTWAVDTDQSSTSSTYNRMAKLLRVARLQKLTKLIRLIKMAKKIQKEKSDQRELKSKFQVSEQSQRLILSLLAFVMLSHIMACFWIFIAQMSTNEDLIQADSSILNTNWILKNGFVNYTDFQIYSVSYYFTVTTITTVGYGDISGCNTSERYFAFIMEVAGVVFFSLISSELARIIENYDNISSSIQEKIIILNKIKKEYKMSNNLYFELLDQIQYENDHKKDEEINQFISSIPYKFKTQITELIYKKNYFNIWYFKGKPENFLAWIIPKLKKFERHKYDLIFKENNQIESVYFQFSGLSGFIHQMIPFSLNIVYSQIQEGDEFGSMDICFSSLQQKTSIFEVLQQTEHLLRQFTVQALTNIVGYQLNIKFIQQMKSEFNEAFESLFSNSQTKLINLLNLKIKTSNLNQEFMSLDEQQQLLEKADEEEKKINQSSITLNLKQISDKKLVYEKGVEFIKKSINLQKIGAKNLSNISTYESNQSISEIQLEDLNDPENKKQNKDKNFLQSLKIINSKENNKHSVQFNYLKGIQQIIKSKKVSDQKNQKIQQVDNQLLRIHDFLAEQTNLDEYSKIQKQIQKLLRIRQNECSKEQRKIFINASKKKNAKKQKMKNELLNDLKDQKNISQSNRQSFEKETLNKNPIKQKKFVEDQIDSPTEEEQESVSTQDPIFNLQQDVYEIKATLNKNQEDLQNFMQFVKEQFTTLKRDINFSQK